MGEHPTAAKEQLSAGSSVNQGMTGEGLRMRLVSPWTSLGFLAVGIILPYIVPYGSLATEFIIFALFTASFNILLGFTGLLSFGHAAFFGIGALAGGLAMVHGGANPVTALGLGTLAALVAALIIGFLCLKSYGISFAFLTLAFAEMIYFIAYQWSSLTGGEDGLAVSRKVFHLFGVTLNLKLALPRYYFILAVVAVCFFLISRILNSPFGRVLASMRENEERTAFLGFNVKTYKLISFSLSGLFAGVAGVLYTIHLAFVPMENMHWGTSGEVVIMTLLGGMGYFFGPAVGTAVFIGLRELVSSFFERWQLFVGVIFVLIVIFAPEGLCGIPQKIRVALHRNRGS